MVLARRGSIGVVLGVHWVGVQLVCRSLCRRLLPRLDFVVMLVILLVMLVIFAVMLVIGSMIVPV